MLTSNKIYNFSEDVPPTGKVVVTVQGPHGLVEGSIVEVLHSTKYIGTYITEDVGTGSFIIKNLDSTYPAFVGDEQGCAWQVTRLRPVLVNPEGETIDTLRQAVNQVSNDLGDKTALSINIDDKRDIVKAINSLSDFVETELSLRALIRSIACN
jgi:hypothetical protein